MHLTSLCSLFGVHANEVLPMALTYAPATFLKIVTDAFAQEIMKGSPVVYLNNI